MKKCAHDFQYELQLDAGKSVNGYILVRKGTLIMSCKLCDHEEEYFCLGGIVKESNNNILDGAE